MKFGAYATMGAIGAAMALGLGLASCRGRDDSLERAGPPVRTAARPAPPPTTQTPLPPVPIDIRAANSSAFTAPPADAKAQSATLLRAEVLLDRAGFSPGVIDGRYGENVRQALAAFQDSRGLANSGRLDAATWDRLQAVGGPAVLASYVITEADVAGPFIAGVPDRLQDQAHLRALSYTSAAELIAERFHMDEDLLRALNPGETFTGAGAQIVVANPARPALTAAVDHIEVDAHEKAVKAFDAAGSLLAFYPATIGSADNPSPSGSMKVNGVGFNPEYVYDPRKVDYAGGKIRHRLIVPPGPNNPVGLVWIDLSRPTFGIHGTPQPDVVGKTQSHGCVRLTNWDVEALAAAVKPGVRVTFVQS